MDIAYAPFIERFQPFLMDVKNYDIKMGRPKLAAWIEVRHTVIICSIYLSMCMSVSTCFVVIIKIFHVMGHKKKNYLSVH